MSIKNIKNIISIDCIFYLCFLSFNINAQNYYDFGFKQELNVIVYDSLGNKLNRPWEGGLNSVQFCGIDMNLDGIEDLVIFDKTGNRILTYLNSGQSFIGTTAFVYAPQYELKFPQIHDWMILADYNNDGKKDIFTYSYGGIAVYKNTSSLTTGMSFELKTPLLLSYQYNGYVNIFLTTVDYPAIADIDGDGDLDILSFFGLGTYLEYHKNQSIEKFGNADSLDYKRVEQCWGYFAESAAGNQITLNINCPWKCNENDFCKNGTKHTGSTMLLLDLNGDNVKDLLLGDIDYSTITALYNGGTNDSAHINLKDTLFPSYDIPINLISLPVTTYFDIDNDGINDLIVSPFEPNPFIPESYRSVWFYKNVGTNDYPVFQFVTDGLFQEEMIDVGVGAYPVLFDVNNDSLVDLLIANYGYRDSSYFNANGFLQSSFTSKIAYYKNIGDKYNPIFKLQTNDFASLSSLNKIALYPAFADIDNDGDADMIIGDSEGELLFFRNIAGSGNNPIMVNESMICIDTLNVGKFSTPQLVDLDNDNLVDLVVGEKNGNLNFFKNIGTLQIPEFVKVTDSLGKVNVTDYNVSYTGYSTPCFFKDASGKWKLFCGSEQGSVLYYDSINSNNLINPFYLKEPMLSYIKKGSRVGVAVSDLNNDGYIDMIIGNLSGGVSYYKGINPPQIGIVEQ
ncbi:MAG TPA: VCBS repeat-containing protein, partial [Bacteroidales bacterium]|nr:VCBS repeat-containing protein [Bacteroidales bacterium]